MTVVVEYLRAMSMEVLLPPIFYKKGRGSGKHSQPCKSGACGKTLLYPTACPCWQNDAPQFLKEEALSGPLFW